MKLMCSYKAVEVIGGHLVLPYVYMLVSFC